MPVAPSGAHHRPFDQPDSAVLPSSANNCTFATATRSPGSEAATIARRAWKYERWSSRIFSKSPDFEITRFSGEEYSTDPREIEPQHIAPNEAMVFYQTLETCAPELATDDAELTVSVRYTDPLTLEELTTSVTARFGDLYAEDTRLLDKGAAVYAYAEALRACQEGAESAWPTLLAPALARLEQAERTNPGDTDLAELRRVMEALGG